MSLSDFFFKEAPVLLWLVRHRTLGPNACRRSRTVFSAVFPHGRDEPAGTTLRKYQQPRFVVKNSKLNLCKAAFISVLASQMLLTQNGVRFYFPRRGFIAGSKNYHYSTRSPKLYLTLINH
jgi:hypothetical protein